MSSKTTHFALALLFAAAASCSRDAAPTAPLPPEPVVPLQDVVIDHLPSPYYHFAYDASGRMSGASFASDFFVYELHYEGGRLAEMRNNILVNHDRLVYAYDNAGRVGGVSYVGSDGVEFTRVHLTYQGQRLVGLQRERRTDAGFLVDKTMSFTYDANGNLFDLTEHFPAVPGVQDDVTFTDRYEDYDTGINVDAFGLIHDEFFDHLVLLPNVRLQKGNPRKNTRSGGGVNYTVQYTYTYDGQNRPLTKTGDLVFSNGANAGQHFQTSSVFTYY